MKRLLSAFLCFVLILSVCCFNVGVSAANANTDDGSVDFPGIFNGPIRTGEDDTVIDASDIFGGKTIDISFLTYTKDSSSVTITACDKSVAGDVALPGTIEGLPVRTIGKRAFRGCTEITKLTLPDTLVTIGFESFNSCTSLKSIVMPESLENIGEGAFVMCESLKEITIPSKVSEIAALVFMECKALKKVVFSGNIVSVGEDAFDGCVSLTDIEIPESVTSVGAYAFWQCPLTNVIISDNVTFIGENAFLDTKITDVRFYSKTQKEKYKQFFPGARFVCLCKGEHTFKDDTSVVCDKCEFLRDVPVLKAKDFSSITVNAKPGFEYSLDKSVWQDSNVFKGLFSNTEYKIYQRAKPNGEISAALKVTTGGFDVSQVNGTDVSYVKIADNVEDKKCYRVHIAYTAAQNNSFAFLTADANDFSLNRGFVEDAGFAVAQSGVTSGITEKDLYFTVDKASVSGAAKGDALYLYIPGKENQITFSVIKTEKLLTSNGKSIISNGGVSMLDGIAADERQALRYYFNYESTSGDDVIINSVSYKLKSRGFLLANGKEKADSLITRQTAKKENSAIIDMSINTFEDCWAYSDNIVTYSTYVTGFVSENGTYNESNRLYVKGYIVVEIDSVEYTFYSSETNMSVKDVAKLQIA